MTDEVDCDSHGRAGQTFVCQHIAELSARVFNSDRPTPDEPWPDAWCERCAEVLERCGGEWNDEAEAFAAIQVMCSTCYLERRMLIDDDGPEAEAEPPFPFLYRCGSCDQTHTGLPTWGADAPLTWREASPAEQAAGRLGSDLCEVGGHFFIRGLIEIPILGSRQRMLWGVWASLSETSFAHVVEHWSDPERGRDQHYFGWVMTQLPLRLYPDTLQLKSHVHPRAPGKRPLLLLEPTEHPLAVDQRTGISMARAEELATLLLAGQGGARA